MRHVFLVDTPGSHAARCRSPMMSRPAPSHRHICLASLLIPGGPPSSPSQPHSLWYTALHAPPAVPPHHHHHHPHDPTNAGGRPSSSHGHDGAPHHHNHHNHHHQQHPRDPRDRSHRRALVERTALARLRHDEQVMDRRRANVAGYGSAWLKPAGVPKTLFQLREERRELEEQAEAHRREALLQAQLAEAEGAEGGGGGGGADGMAMLADGDEDLMGAGAEEGEEVQDLDDEIPEAEGFGFDGEESDDEEEEEDDEEDDEDEDDDETLSESEGGPGEDHAGAVQLSPAEEEEQQVRDMRAAEDRLRQMMAREQDGGSDAGDDAFRDGGGSREGLLEEDDLVHMRPSAADDTPAVADISMGMDMDMDADLDEDIPEAYDDDDDDVGGGGLYEHTDSDEGLSDDDDATRELSFAGRSSIGGGGGGIGGNAPPGSSSRLRRSVHGSVRRASLRSRGDRESLAQSDMDISGLLSNNDSSFLADSPYARRGGS